MTDRDRAALAPAGDQTGVIIETTSAGFRVDVLAQSARQPVLVYFWTPGSSSCQQLKASLEKIARSAQGRFRLATMDIERDPGIAEQLGIQAAPAAIAFQKGQPVDGFAGPLPESQIKGFLERLIGPIGGELEDLLAEAEVAAAAGHADAARALFAEAHQLDATDLKAIAGLAKSLVAAGDLADAEAVLARAVDLKDAAGVLAPARAALDLARQAETVGDFSDLEKMIAADPANHQARFDLAVALNGAGERSRAADALLDIMRMDRTWNEDAARRQLLQFFEAWGYMEPDTIAARRKLSVLIFA